MISASAKVSPLEKLKDAKKALITILEVFNAKYAGELKKDNEKEIKFIYSKFSQIAECIKQDRKVLLRDMLSLVQTNLMKLLIEMKEKDKIY